MAFNVGAFVGGMFDGFKSGQDIIKARNELQFQAMDMDAAQSAMKNIEGSGKVGVGDVNVDVTYGDKAKVAPEAGGGTESGKAPKDDNETYWTPEGLAKLRPTEGKYDQIHYPTGYTKDGVKSSASGGFGFIDPTWQTYAARAGVDIQKYPRAYMAPPEVQDMVALQTPIRHWTGVDSHGRPFNLAAQQLAANPAYIRLPSVSTPLASAPAPAAPAAPAPAPTALGGGAPVASGDVDSQAGGGVPAPIASGDVDSRAGGGTSVPTSGDTDIRAGAPPTALGGSAPAATPQRQARVAEGFPPIAMPPGFTRSPGGGLKALPLTPPQARDIDQLPEAHIGRGGKRTSALSGLGGTDTASNDLYSGAKRAPDGRDYVPDPNRPGKYLLVDYG